MLALAPLQENLVNQLQINLKNPFQCFFITIQHLYISQIIYFRWNDGTGILELFGLGDKIQFTCLLNLSNMEHWLPRTRRFLNKSDRKQRQMFSLNFRLVQNSLSRSECIVCMSYRLITKYSEFGHSKVKEISSRSFALTLTCNTKFIEATDINTSWLAHSAFDWKSKKSTVLLC